MVYARRMAWLSVLMLVLVGFGDGFGIRQTEVLLEGYLDAAPKKVHPIRTVVVQIGDGPERKFAVTKILVTDGSMLGLDVLDQLQPIKPQFRITGDDALMARISGAHRDRLKITGVINLNDHYFLVSRVEYGKPPATPTPAPS